jgi:hypothetical protein
MKNLISRVSGGLLAGLALALLVVGSGLYVAAQPVFSPRIFPTQQVHYMRFPVNFNSCPLPAAAGNCSYKVGAVPYNSWILRGVLEVFTSFNSTTTDTVALSTASGTGALLVAGTSTHGAAGVTQLTIVTATGLGVQSTGNNIAQTGSNGGFDIWANLAYTGASPATAGAAAIVLEYAAPNDGLCGPVALGATAPGC